VWAYVLLQLAASTVLAGLGWWWLRRDLARVHAQPLWMRPLLGDGLRLGWTMMPVSIAGAAYSFALPAAASLQMSKADLGTYFMADRFVRAVLNAAEPVFAVVYPRIVTLFKTSARAALRYAAAWSAGGVVVGALLLGTGLLAWPAIEPLVLRRAGDLDRAEPARDHGRPRLPCCRCCSAGSSSATGYSAAAATTRAYRACVVVGGIAGVIGAATWGGAAGATGLAWVAIGVELLVMAVAVGGVLVTQRARA
jgi:hypothetical protein